MGYPIFEGLEETLELHEKWLNGDPDGKHADLIGEDLCEVCLSGRNLSGANLNDADLNSADLSGTNLSNASLCYANLSFANLCGADLSEVRLEGADLSGTNMSGVKNLVSPIDFLSENFEHTEKGYVVYKVFDNEPGTVNDWYGRPDNWVIEPDSIIEEVVNPERQNISGSGINVAPLQWVKDNYKGEIWKCLIEWPWLAGVVVPYESTGKIRCERVRLLEIVKENN